MGNNTTVLIIGAGPTGLTLALELARHNINCQIIDQLKTPIQTSNALAVQPRTLEIWQKMGLLDDALKLGQKLYAFNLYSGSKMLAHVSLQGIPSDFPFILSLPQAETEVLLTRELAKKGVKVKRPYKLTQCEELDDHIQATIENENESYQVNADWLVGCDGGGSTVRKLQNIKFTGEELTEKFIMTDALVKSTLNQDEMYAFLSANGPLAILPSGEGITRLIIEVTNEKRLANKLTPTLEDFKQLVKERCPLPFEIKKAYWISSFNVHRRLAEKYRAGRVFLAGDAAHLHSPVGGQGMNTGIQDAYYLAELLQNVILHNSPQQSLNHYQQKRQSIAKKVLKNTTQATHLISLRSPFLQFIRNTFIKLILKSRYVSKRIATEIAELNF